MSQANFTPISLYYSTTASAVPTAANLVPGELAINTADGKLYYEDSSGVVQVLATKSTGSIGGSNTQVQFNNSGSLGGSSGLTWDGSFLTTSSIKNSALTSGRVTFAGASGLLSDSANLQFTGSVLGVGATPSTWFNDYRVMQLGAGASLSGRTTNSDSMQLMANVYRDASADYRYIDTNVATQYQQTSGVHLWYNAPSGTAGNVISFTERMRITSDGNLGIGISSPVAKLQVKGSGTSGQVSASWILENSSSGTLGMDITGSPGASYARFLYGGGPSTGTNALTETMRIGLEGASVGVQQIKFAATAVPSANANTLDDYEEGTWTPGVGNQTVVGTFSSSGTYTKIGRQVTVRGYASSTGTIAGAAGTYFDNLPFASSTDFPGGIGTNDGGSFARFFGLNASSNSLFIVSGYAAVTGVFFSCTYFV